MYTVKGPGTEQRDFSKILFKMPKTLKYDSSFIMDREVVAFTNIKLFRSFHRMKYVRFDKKSQVSGKNYMFKYWVIFLM